MEVAGQPDSLFRGRGLSQPLAQGEVIHAGDGQPRDDFAELAVVPCLPRLVQREAPPFDRLSVQAPREDRADAEPLLQFLVERTPRPFLPLVARSDENRDTIAPGVRTKEAPAREMPGDQRTESPERFIAEIELAVRAARYAGPRLFRLFPDHHHSRSLENARRVIEQLPHDPRRLPCILLWPCREPGSLRPQPLLVGPQIAEQGGHDKEVRA